MAEFVIDYGPDWHLLWVVFIDATGECRTVQNPEVRLQRNETLGTQPDARRGNGVTTFPAAPAKNQ